MQDRLFIDTNILIYLVDEKSSFHEKSKNKFIKLLSEYELWISRQIIREYAVITTRTGLIANPVSSETLIDDINRFCKIFHVANETTETTKNLLNLIEKYNICGKRIHDTNIVATMIENNILNLYTHNFGDFKNFTEIKIIDFV